MEALKRLAKLIDVKTIVTFAVVGTLCYLAIKQNVQIPSEAFVMVITAIITYFFTRKNNSDKK